VQRGCEKKGTAGALGVRRLRRRFVISTIDERIIVTGGHYCMAYDTFFVACVRVITKRRQSRRTPKAAAQPYFFTASGARALQSGCAAIML